MLESEGTRESDINVAEGRKQAQILASEAQKAEQINKAAGEPKGQKAQEASAEGPGWDSAPPSLESFAKEERSSVVGNCWKLCCFPSSVLAERPWLPFQGRLMHCW